MSNSAWETYREDLERFGPSYSIGDVGIMMEGLARYDELRERGQQEEANALVWSVRENFRFALMTPEELQELESAAREELDSFRESLDSQPEKRDE